MLENKYNLITQNSISIKADLHKAFHYFADLNNYSTWFPEVVQMKEVDQSPIETINKAYEEKVFLDDSGNSTFITVKVKEFIKNEKIITQAQFEPLFPQMTIGCSTIDDDTISISFKFESRSEDESYLNSEEYKFIKNLLASRANTALDNLKNILEN